MAVKRIKLAAFMSTAADPKYRWGDDPLSDLTAVRVADALLAGYRILPPDEQEVQIAALTAEVERLTKHIAIMHDIADQRDTIILERTAQRDAAQQALAEVQAKFKAERSALIRTETERQDGGLDMTREQERAALAKLIDPFSQGAAGNEAGEAADRILAAGYRQPPAVGAGDEGLVATLTPNRRGVTLRGGGTIMAATEWDARELLAILTTHALMPPDWPDDAAVERAADVWWEHFDGPFLSNKGAHPSYEAAVRKGMCAALRAAVSAQGETE